MEEARGHNSTLRAELARLQELAASLGVDPHDPERAVKKEKSRRRLHEVSEIKKAFDRFDVRRNGFIDKEDLAGVAASLGEYLDGEELDAAFKRLDLNKDGKISFNEFAQWWAADDRLRTDKSVPKLGLLRAKMAGQYLYHGMPQLLRTLSEQKVDDTSDWNTYNVMFRVGHVGSSSQPPEPGSPQLSAWAHLDVSFRHALDSDDFMGCSSLLQMEFTPNLEEDESDRAEAQRDFIRELASSLGAQDEHIKVSEESKERVRIGIASNFPDPLQGSPVDFTKLVRELSFKLDLAYPVADILESEKSGSFTLASRLAFRLEARFEFRKALSQAIAAMSGDADKALVWAFLEKFNTRLCLGSVEPFLDLLESPEGTDPLVQVRAQQELQIRQLEAMGLSEDIIQVMREQHELQLEQMRGNQDPIQPQIGAFRDYLMSSDFQEDLRLRLHSLLSQSLLRVYDRQGNIKQAFEQLTAVHFFTPSGLHVRAVFKDFLPLQLVLPDPDVDGEEGAEQNAAEGEGEGQ